MLILTTLALAVVVTVTEAVLLLKASPLVRVSYLVGDLVVALLLVGVWYLNRLGSTHWASYLYLAVLTIATSTLFPAESLDRILVLYAVPIITASFLIESSCSFLFALLSILGYSLAYLVYGVTVSYNYIPMPALFALAFVARHIADRLERSLAAATREIAKRERAEEEVRQQAEALAALHETALDLTAQQASSVLLEAIVARSVNLLAAKGGDIYLYRPVTDDLEIAFIHNLAPDVTGTVLQRGEGLAGRVLESSQPLAVTHYSRWEGRVEQFEEAGLDACVAVPIPRGNRLIGVLCLVDDAPRTFSTEDIVLLERFAALAAVALENARLYRDLQQQMDELKRAQAQLVHSAKLAAVGQLAAGVAHELNNPLTCVLGYAELILRTIDPDSPLRQDLETILNEARRTQKIVQNLLDFSRQKRPERRLTDVNEILQQSLAVLRYHLERTGVAIDEDYAPDIGLVHIDENQMKQVLLNLISNATRAMPEGGTLSVRTIRKGSDVVVSVTDTGVGIPEENLDRIFDPFFTTNHDGTGLGLSVSLGLVQEHGGRITVESKVGRGSTFSVWLPTNEAPARAGAAGIGEGPPQDVVLH